MLNVGQIPSRRHESIRWKSLCLFTGDIYAIGTSADSTLVVSVVDPHRHRMLNAWKIYNVTVTIAALR